MGIAMRLLSSAIFSRNLSCAVVMPKSKTHNFLFCVLMSLLCAAESASSQNNAANLAAKFSTTNLRALPAKEAFIEVSHYSLTGSEVIVTGRAHKRAPAEQMQVALAFQSETGPIAIPLTLQRLTPDTARVVSFAFETVVHGLPQIESNDPRHAQPFFAIHLAERGGAQYYQEKSYAQFISASDKPFTLPPVMELPTQCLWTRVRKPVNRAAQTSLIPKLKLVATRPNSEVCALEWSPVANAASTVQTLALVFRNEKHIGVAFTSRYVDRVTGLPANVKYRVEQIGKDGVTLSSNIVTLPPEYVQDTPRDTGGLYAADKYKPRTPEALAAVVSKHNPAIQYCYQREVKRNTALRGEIRVRIVINPGGSVDSVNVISSTLQNPAVEDCVVGRIKRWNDFGPSDPARGGVAIKQTYVFGY